MIDFLRIYSEFSWATDLHTSGRGLQENGIQRVLALEKTMTCIISGKDIGIQDVQVLTQRQKTGREFRREEMTIDKRRIK